MSLEGVLSAIRRETEAEVTAVIATSKADAASRIRAAQEEAARIEVEATCSKDAATTAEARRRTRQASVDARQMLRAAREAAFGEVLDEVRRRLANLRRDPVYPGVLSALLAEARAALADAKVVRSDPADLPLIEAMLNADEPSPCLEIESVLTTWGGLELDTGGGCRVINTLESRLERAEPHLRGIFAASIPFPPHQESGDDG